MQLKQSGKPYERLKISVIEFAEENVLTASGQGSIEDNYDDGWNNPFWSNGGID